MRFGKGEFFAQIYQWLRLFNSRKTKLIFLNLSEMKKKTVKDNKMMNIKKICKKYNNQASLNKLKKIINNEIQMAKKQKRNK